MFSFSYLEPVFCSMSSSNCCFLTCIQVSQEAGQVVWYSHLLQNFPQLVLTHTVKGFGTVNKAEEMFFWNSLAFLMIQQMLAIRSLIPLPFLKPAWTSGSSRFTYCWSLAWTTYIQFLLWASETDPVFLEAEILITVSMNISVMIRISLPCLLTSWSKN